MWSRIVTPVISDHAFVRNQAHVESRKLVRDIKRARTCRNVNLTSFLPFPITLQNSWNPSQSLPLLQSRSPGAALPRKLRHRVALPQRSPEAALPRKLRYRGSCVTAEVALPQSRVTAESCVKEKPPLEELSPEHRDMQQKSKIKLFPCSIKFLQTSYLQ
jgi:hypothetical protein